MTTENKKDTTGAAAGAAKNGGRTPNQKKGTRGPRGPQKGREGNKPAAAASAALAQPAARKVPAPAQTGGKAAATGTQQKKTTRSKRGRPKKTAVTPVKLTPLGGLNEIGKNITLFEYGDDAFLIDCGMAFPDDDMLGVDIVLPDFTYVEKNKDRIKGIVLTHGHEDHIGGLPYLLKQMNFPLYGSRLTLALVESKLKEHGLAGKVAMNVVEAGSVVKFGAVSVEFISVNHSIPDAMALGIKTPIGYVVHTGDFKIDCGSENWASKGCWPCWRIPPTRNAPATPPASGWWAKASPTSLKKRSISGLSSPPSLPTCTGFSRSSRRPSRMAGRWRFPAAA